MKTVLQKFITTVLAAAVILIASGHDKALSMPPSVYVSPGQFDFGSDKNELLITVANYGDAAGRFRLRIEYKDDSTGRYSEKSNGWLHVDREEIALGPNEEAAVSATVDRSGYAPGTYYAAVDIIDVESNSSSGIVFVSMTIEPKLPKLEIEQEQSLFLLWPTGKAVLKIKNTGDGDLIWAAEPTQYYKGASDWLAVSPSSGVASAGEKIPITIEVSGYAPSPGNYTATIPVKSNGGNVDIEVQMIVTFFMKVRLHYSALP